MFAVLALIIWLPLLFANDNVCRLRGPKFLIFNMENDIIGKVRDLWHCMSLNEETQVFTLNPIKYYKCGEVDTFQACLFLASERFGYIHTGTNRYLSVLPNKKAGLGPKHPLSQNDTRAGLEHFHFRVDTYQYEIRDWPSNLILCPDKIHSWGDELFWNASCIFTPHDFGPSDLWRLIPFNQNMNDYFYIQPASTYAVWAVINKNSDGTKWEM